MASLPTAYASQRFGRKGLDFYAAAGDVIGADPRARSDERRLQDLEGARHTVRLMETGFRLDPGDQASVLRMQPGPARRSRPVAVVNHSTGAWSRTHPGATGLLARAGVARTWNWVLTLTLFALTALTVVWPYLRAFLVEIDPATFSVAPDLNVFALAIAAAPGLADWRIADLIAPLAAPLVQAAPMLAGLETGLVFGLAALGGALVVYALRSWRLVWAPLLVGAIGAGALGFDGATSAGAAALSGLGLAAGVFLVGGLVNRVRDGARLERRIAVLADHVLRNAPEEMIADTGQSADTPAQAEADADAEQDGAPVPAPIAAAYRGADNAEEQTMVEPAPAQSADPEADAGADEQVGDVQADAEPGDAENSAGGEGGELGAETDAGDRALAAAPEPESAAEAGGEADSTSGQPEAHADPESRVDAASQGASEDAGAADTHGADTPASFEDEENERLRTDPRYAARAIVLPPPPPMPSAQSETGPQSDLANADVVPDETTAPSASDSATRTLKPDGPLAPNVVPMFAAPAPARRDEEPVD